MKNNNLIYGTRPIIEAINAGKEIDKILIQKNIKSEQLPILRSLISEYSIPFQYVPIEKLNRLTKANHQGIVCFVSPISYQPIDQLLISLFEKGETPIFVILDRITDVRNFGAIVRTAECAGVNAVIIPNKNSAPINADAIKTSAGAIYNMPIHKSNNLKETIKYLKNSGLKIIAASEHASSSYKQANFSTPIALIVGSEEDGISNEYIKLCDEIIKIPMKGSIGSLNVSVAAGVLLFEIASQNR